jgi:flagellar assembly protein FliH
MSNPVLPKEKLTAYHRWELAALPGQGGRAHNGPASEATRLPLPLPTADEVERIHQAAHAEGLAEGRERAAGILAELAALLSSATLEVRTWEEKIADDIVSLALEIAHQVVRESLVVRREAIVAVVRDAMQQMPLFKGSARLLLHPSDVEMVREGLNDQITQLGWRLIEDESIERGGCRIESEAAQIDATNATRWERAVATLGRDRTWLERGVGRRGPAPTKAAA